MPRVYADIPDRITPQFNVRVWALSLSAVHIFALVSTIVLMPSATVLLSVIVTSMMVSIVFIVMKINSYIQFNRTNVTISSMGRKKIIPYSEMEYVRVVLTQSNTLALPAPDSTKSDKYLVIGKKSPMHNSHYYVETYGHKTRYTYFKKRVKNMFARNELAIKMNYFPFQIEDIINKINMKREVA